MHPPLEAAPPVATGEQDADASAAEAARLLSSSTDLPHVLLWSARVGRVATLLALVTLAIALYLIHACREFNAEDRQGRLDQARVETTRAIRRIQHALGDLEQGAHALASAVGAPRTPADARTALSRFLQTHPTARAAGILLAEDAPAKPTPGADASPAFAAPAAFEVRRAARRPTGAPAETESSLHAAALERLLTQVAHPGWQEPDAEARRASTAVRFLKPLPSGRGAVFVDYDADHLAEVVGAIDNGDAGFTFIVSRRGAFVYYPEREVATAGLELAESCKSGFLPELPAALRAARSGLVEGPAGDSPCTVSVWFDTVPSTAWSVCVGQVLGETRSAAHRAEGDLMIQTALVVVLFLLLSLVACLARSYRGGTRRLWVGSLGVSVIIIAATAFVWWLVLSDQMKRDDPRFSSPIADAGAEARFRTMYGQLSQKMDRRPPIFIPTGIYIQALEFTSPNNVKLSGWLWQKYPVGLPSDVRRGVTFSEGTDIKLEESYRQREFGYELIRWHFQGTVREEFNYLWYPLDRAVAWVRLAPQALPHSNEVLVPDLAAYPMPNPAARPGIENGIVLGSWKLESSYFNYHFPSYNTNFGNEHESQLGHPELYFNMEMQRDFVHAFVVNLVPIFVVTTLLFALLITISHREAVSLRYSVKTPDVLSICSGLLFATILAHSRLRTDFAAQTGIIYMEYFYFLQYLLILAVPLNAFVVAADVRLPLLHYEDGILPKILYWPLVYGAVLTLTVVFFY